VWVKKKFPELPWCRYADDGLIHCRTEQEAREVRAALDKRLEECKLKMHPEKTKIVYCKDDNRRGEYPNWKFDFLGYTFRQRLVKSNRGALFVSFTAAVAAKALKSMRQTIRKRNLRNRTDLELKEISKMFNPILRGWMEYYGKFNPSSMDSVFNHFNSSIRAWAMRKYKKFNQRRRRAACMVENIARKQPRLFIHWERGILGMAS
jgi:RNA-directed DNA polymerase